MKKDLGADAIEIHIKEEFVLDWPSISSKNRTIVEIIAK